MTQNTKRLALIIGSLITGLTLIISFFLKPLEPLPTIISTTPRSGATDIAANSPIALKFDREVDLAKLSVVSIPEENWEVAYGNTNSIVVIKSQQLFRSDKEYQVSVSHDNNLLTTLTFTTIEQLGDSRYTQEVNQEMKQDYPLATKFPLKRTDYTVIYSQPLTLEITLKNTNAERDLILNAIRDLVEESGLDPNSHSYTFAN